MRKLFLLIIPMIIFAKCNYKLNLEIDLDKKEIKGNSIITSDEKVELKNMNLFEEINYRSANGKKEIQFRKKYKSQISKDFIYLLGNWYPKVKNYCSYEVSLTLPKEFEAIMEADSIKSEIKNGKKQFTFIMPKEISSISLIASNDFKISRKSYNNIDIYTYFFSKDQKLSQKYLNKTVEYIKSYEKLVGEFPYKRFSIVENHFQTGYSMPTFTLIGDRIIDKEYLLNRSLGHEILHQYFGNSVFNNFSKGNWVEGLVTYLSDWQLEKDRLQHRKNILNSYPLYVNKKDEFPIKKFTHRVDKKSMFIGYSKFAFVFHMIKNQIGEEKFNQKIKRIYEENKFKELNLAELSKYFNFDSWLGRIGLIDFKIKNLKRYYDRDSFWVEFEVNQPKNSFYNFNLPMEIETYDGVITKKIAIKSHNQKVKINLKSEPLKIVFDKNYDLFRKLSEKEEINSIAKVLNAKELVIVKYDDKYKGIEKIFKNAKVIDFKDFSFEDLKTKNILILDKENELLKQLNPNIEIKPNSLSFKVLKNIYNPKTTISILHTDSNLKKLRVLKYYSKQSNISFSQNKTTKEIAKTQNGILFTFNKKQNIPKIKNRKIIYVGESHNRFSHHLKQLRVIKKLYKNNKKIAIGMEMFIEDFQSIIDEYIEGKLTLKEFLKKSEYYKSWKFNYNLYKPIIDFAKENKIKIVALNIDRSITQKVAKSGIYSLTTKERAKLPKEMNQLNEKYKKRLTSFFKTHNSVSDKRYKMPKINIDFYYQAQLIWDEIMAENIDKFLQLYPEYKIIVLAGSGHIKDENAIPKRAFRRNGLEYEVILNSYKYTKEIEVKQGKQIGVYLNSDDDLSIIKIVPNSYASKTKIKVGDKIISINGTAIKNLYELKSELYFIDDLNSIKLEFDE